MNTRLQVEHPVTEMITGQDLVEWQLRVAAGEPLPATQAQLAIRGHAIEVRIYAEDPDRGFLPSIGRIDRWRMPVEDERVRLDTGFREGDEVSPHYDPMLAKLIVHGEDRERARRGMIEALGRCRVVGVTTNLALLERIAAHESFASGRVDTGLIERHRDVLLAPPGPSPERALAAAAIVEHEALRVRAAEAAAAAGDPHSPWQATDGHRPGGPVGVDFDFVDAGTPVRVGIRPAGRAGSWSVALPGRRVDVLAAFEADGALAVDMDGERTPVEVFARGEERHVFAAGIRCRLLRVDPLAHAGEVEEHAGHMIAPMSGTVVAVLVKPGDLVAKGAPLVVLEAMKMEHTIVAPAPGIVLAVNFAPGDKVSEGADLVDLRDPD